MFDTINPAKSFFGIDVADTYNEMIDSLISDCGLTYPCKLIYSSASCVTCPNCVYNPVTKKSLNKYKAGGPIEFDYGTTCPFCLGNGQYQYKSEEMINMFVCFNSKKFEQPLGVASPVKSAGSAQTVSRIEWYMMINSADFAYFNICDGCISDKYKRSAKPSFLGIGRPKYILTDWELV